MMDGPNALHVSIGRFRFPHCLNLGPSRHIVLAIRSAASVVFSLDYCSFIVRTIIVSRVGLIAMTFLAAYILSDD